MHGILFEGDKANFSGDGIQTTENMQGNLWTMVKINNMSGDSIVPDRHYFNTFAQCRFQNSGGWGMHVLDNGTGGHVSQNYYGNFCIIGGNDAGGVKYETENDFVHSETYDLVTLSQNSGPAFYAQVTTLPNFTFLGSIVENDGPAFLFEDSVNGNRAQINGARIKANFDNNNKDFANVPQVIDNGTRDSGLIHLQSDDSEFTNVYLNGLTLEGRINNPNSDHIIASYDQTQVKGDVGVGSSGGISSSIRMSAIESKVTLSGAVPYSVANAPSDGVALVIGEQYIEELVSGGKVYLGTRGSTPHAASGSGDVYIDTSQNPPKWQIDDPTDSAWETM